MTGDILLQQLLNAGRLTAVPLWHRANRKQWLKSHHLWKKKKHHG